MSVTLDETKQLPAPQAIPEPELPDERVLEDKTPGWFRTTPVSSLLTLLIGAVFIVMANRPLWHTDLWDHLNYGENILATRTISPTEPLLHLCRGMPMVNIPWLAQIGMATLNNRFGLTSLQFVFAALISLSASVIAWRTLSLSRSAMAAVVASAVFLKVNLDQLLVIRPQLCGLLLYCVVVAWMYARKKHSKFSWAAMPILFALWANVHGSFVIGLMVMVIAGVGRFGDVLSISKSLRTALSDPEFHRTLLLTQVCAAAVLLNPSGLAVYPEVLNVSRNPNVASMIEWEPLTLRTAQGQAVAAAALLAFLAIKLSPRRLRCGEMLAFVVTGLMAAWSTRMLNWWTPLAGIVIGTHLMAAVRKSRKSLPRPAPATGSGLWTLVNGGLLWILVSLTPFGVLLLHGRTPEANRLVSSDTPLATAAFLDSMESIPSGTALLPAEWAGYLSNRGPQALQPMVNLHVHVIPKEIWDHYLRIINGPEDWNILVDSYGINLAVVSKTGQPALLRKMEESEEWASKYEDHQAVVFQRKQPI